MGKSPIRNIAEGFGTTHEVPAPAQHSFVGDAEFGDRKIHVSGDVLLTVGGFPPDGVSPGHVTQLLGGW